MQSIEPEKIAELEKKINCEFSDKDLLKRALTRRSFAQENFQKSFQKEFLKCHQEVFCVLGDAIISATLCDLLIQNGIETKGDITKTKSSLENQGMLAKIGRSINLHNYIIANSGEKSSGVVGGDKVIAETLEAIIAAVYYDKGFICAKEVVAFLFKDELESNFSL